MLLTRSRLCPGPKPGSSLHLHVLSTPPAFVLSQDQTLREELLAHEPEGLRTVTKSSSVTKLWRQYTGDHGHDGSILAAGISIDAGRSNLDAHLDLSIQVRMLLSFQRPPRPVGKGVPSPYGALGRGRPRRIEKYSAGSVLAPGRSGGVACIRCDEEA